MSMWKFCNTENLEDFLLSSLGDRFMIPGGTENQVVYFHNGDKMTVDTKTGVLEWEPIAPGAIGTSRLSMKLHMWYGKGIIAPSQEGEA